MTRADDELLISCRTLPPLTCIILIINFRWSEYAGESPQQIMSSFGVLFRGVVGQYDLLANHFIVIKGFVVAGQLSGSKFKKKKVTLASVRATLIWG